MLATAEVDACCNKNSTPLHLALQFEHAEIVSALVGAGYCLFMLPVVYKFSPPCSIRLVRITHTPLLQG